MKKAKQKKDPDISRPPDMEQLPVLPSDLAEHAQALSGMSSEELIKLLESLGRIDDSISVSRRRPVKGKNFSKEIGGRRRKMTIEEAVEYEKKRAEERLEKERQVKELYGLEANLLQREEINDEIYPKRLTPDDIARSLDAARERMIELDRLRDERKKTFSIKEEIVLNILTLVKKFEAARVARAIAERQRDTVRGKTVEELETERKARIRRLKGEPEPIVETPEEKEVREKREEEEKQELIRTLPGFDKHNRTLTEEAGELANENIDAAAAVVRQWIGNVVTGEKE